MLNAASDLVRKSENKRSIVSPRRRLEGNIKMDLREMGWKYVDRIRLAQDRD